MSTPIETNTEELQEILQTVNNLPNVGSSSGGAPDMVITIDASISNCEIDGHRECVSFDPAQMMNVYNKVRAGEPVNCVANVTYMQSSILPVTSCLHSNCVYAPPPEKVDGAAWLGLYFNLPYMITTMYEFLLTVEIGMMPDGEFLVGSVTCMRYGIDPSVAI